METSPFVCDLCMETFSVKRKPRILPCGHSYCGPCLHKLTVGNSIQCPDCKQQCKTKVNSLSINYKLMPSNEDTLIQGGVFCTTHNLVQKYWCAKCQAVICSECVAEAHRFHDFIRIGVIAGKKFTEKHLYKDRTDKIILSLENKQQEIKRIKENSSSLLDQCSQVEDSIDTLLSKMLAGRAVVASKLGTTFLAQSFLAAADVVDNMEPAVQNIKGLEEKSVVLQNWLEEMKVRN